MPSWHVEGNVVKSAPRGLGRAKRTAENVEVPRQHEGPRGRSPWGLGMGARKCVVHVTWTGLPRREAGQTGGTCVPRVAWHSEETRVKGHVSCGVDEERHCLDLTLASNLTVYSPRFSSTAVFLDELLCHFCVTSK